MNEKGQTRHPQQGESDVAEIGGLTRRELMQRASMLGLAAAYGGFGGTMPAFAADFDMKKYAGTKISLLMTGDENDHRVLAEMMPQFVEETGMAIRPFSRIAEAAQYFRKSDGSPVNNRGGFWIAEQVSLDESAKVENDHELVWLHLHRALAQLRHDAHAWAVAAWLRRTG